MKLKITEEECLNGVAVYYNLLIKQTKKFIEESFVSGGIKVIFSKEILAVGLNIPATTETVDKNLLYRTSALAVLNTALKGLKNQLNISYTDILYYAEKKTKWKLWKK
uniref:Uncharacterized protein n=1 Tax=Strongyloides venezuelensis TaxID=75913 RepID=A0A0K0G5L6_STRVS